jgi:hypothetical protein
MADDNFTNKLAVTPEYVETYKYSKWVECYTNEKNPKTYSNGIQSVFAAYGGTMSYGAASNIAVDNMKKFRYLRQHLAEKAGFTFEKFQKATISKFLHSDKSDWYGPVKEVTGFDEILPEKTKGTGIAVKTENKDGTTTEVKIVAFEQPKPDDTSKDPTTN